MAVSALRPSGSGRTYPAMHSTFLLEEITQLLEDEHREFLEHILRSAETMQTILDDFIDVAAPIPVYSPAGQTNSHFRQYLTRVSPSDSSEVLSEMSFSIFVLQSPRS